MKKIFLSIILLFFLKNSIAQGLHFSQFYNAPLLLSPANTGLLDQNDYRGGVQYRNQWSTIAVPYNTFSAFVDAGFMRAKNETHWLGLGLAFWNDKAGAGNLSLNKVQLNAAYHILANDRSSFSFGMAVASVSRSIDLSKLTFDSQWDELSYNSDLPSKEKVNSGKTNYMDLQAGVNYTYNNNRDFYIKIGAAAQHLNTPTETFLAGNNKLGIRPLASIEAMYKASNNFMFLPSVYYTQQKNASELVFGAMTNTNLVSSGYNSNNTINKLLLGAYYRLGDALIFATGYQYQNITYTISYDHTFSGLTVANKGLGAFEFSVIAERPYKNNIGTGRTLGCPRF